MTQFLRDEGGQVVVDLGSGDEPSDSNLLSGAAVGLEDWLGDEG